MLAILWGTAVFLGYYYTHKPIRPENAVALAKLALTALAWVGTIISAHRVGGFFSRWLPPLPNMARFALRIGLGLGVIGLLTLLMGAVRAYYSGVFWTLLILGSVWGARGFLREFSELFLKGPEGSFQALVSAFVALMVAISLLRSLAPPVAWDSLVYHLTGPKLYLQAHGIHHNVDLPYLGFPGWGAMLFTWGMGLAGPALAQLMHLTFMPLTLCMMIALVGAVAPKQAWFSLAVLLSAPSLILVASWAYVEWMTLFAAVAALWVLSAGELFGPNERGWSGAGPWRDGTAQQQPGPGLKPSGVTARDRALGPASLVGMLAGLAFSAKYTTIGLVLALGVLVLLRRRSCRDLTLFAIVFGLTIAPYLVKNWLLTGNPVYPFFLPGEYWDAHRAFWYSRPGTGLSLGEILLAPWEATVWGVEGGAFEGHLSYGASIGPLLLTLLPLGAIYWRRSSGAGRRLVTRMGVISLIVYMQWAAMLAYSALLIQTRLLFMIFPMVAMFGALGLEGLKRASRRGLRADFVLRALILLSLGLTATGHLLTFISPSPLPVITGSQPVGDYLLARLGGHYLAMERINALPASSQITFLWEPRSFYCAERIRCEPDALLDRWWHLRQHELTAEEIAERWRAQGTSHVLYYAAGAEAVREAGYDPLDRSDWLELEQMLDHELVEVIDWDNGYTLYRLP
jgi:hypothetical protein